MKKSPIKASYPFKLIISTGGKTSSAANEPNSIKVVDDNDNYSLLTQTREERGLSIEEVAARIGISPIELTWFEQGLDIENKVLVDNCFWEILLHEASRETVDELRQQLDELRKQPVIVEISGKRYVLPVVSRQIV